MTSVPSQRSGDRPDRSCARSRSRASGCGIADSEMSKIFDKFYRVIENGGEIDSGGGLGLSIVHSIITTHGGSVSVDSEIEKGTTFIINLPLLAAVRN